MLSMNYEFTARAKQSRLRPILMSFWALAGLCGMVMIALTIIFPKQALMQQASQQKLGDPLAVSYLSNMLKADSSNLEVRVLLAEHRLFLNDTVGMEQLLEPVIQSDSATWRAQGLLLKYKFLTNRYHASVSDATERERLVRNRIEVLWKLYPLEWPMPTLIYLAAQADQLHELGISTGLYSRLSESSALMSIEDFSATASRLLNEGNYELSAHLYFIARHKVTAFSKQREYFLAGVRALISGNLLEPAMRAIDRHVGTLGRDPETLYALILAARAANDQPRAVRYAKQLMHIASPDMSIFAWLQQLDFSLIGIGNAAAATDEATSAMQKLQPYVKKNYDLAYQVFIENASLKEAYRVAATAVQQSPEDAIWHLRLAQIAEWTDRPQESLREWRWLLRNNETMEALRGVLRLAPSLNEFDVLLNAWQRLALRQKLEAAQWENMAQLFELTGRQREGIIYFEQRYAEQRLPLHLEIAARLAERGGDDDKAMALYVLLLAQRGSDIDTAMQQKLANLYLRKAQYRKAYDLLQTNRQQVKGDDIVYWRLLAFLAWHLQQDADAEEDFRRLAKSGGLAREDFSRLIYLLGDSRPAETAALAELAYSRYGERDMLLLALQINADQENRPAQKRLFERASLDRQLNISGNARFYLLRAHYRLATGDYEAARKDFHHALNLTSYHSDSAESNLWFLINSHDQSGLRVMLAQVISHGDQNNPSLWGVLAAAYQSLDQPSRAVSYYTRQFKQSAPDFLWLMSYAEVLEQVQQAGMAARVRRHAWLQARDRLSAPLATPFYSQEMLGALQLSLLNHPGDAASTLVRAVLRQDRLLQQGDVMRHNINGMSLAWSQSLNSYTEETERRVSDLILGWTVSRERSANAKAWLWRRYARSLERPLWAQSAVAMAEQDANRIGALLGGEADGLAMLTRYDAQKLLGRSREAQSTIYQGLIDNPDSDAIHERLTEATLADASELNMGWRAEKLGGLHRLTREVGVEMPIARTLRLGVEYRNAQQGNDETSIFGVTPQLESVTGVLLKYRGGTGDTELGLRRRSEYLRTTESFIKHDMQILPRLQLRLGAELNAQAAESNALQAFGMRNQVAVNVRYALSNREYFQIETAWSHYRAQDNVNLGAGNRLSWEMGSRIRIEYPDLNVRVNGVHTRSKQSEIAALALPGDANVYGVCGGLGETARNTYARVWRPYMDYCITQNTASGLGYSAMLGLVGAAIVNDQLSLTLRQERGGANRINGLSHELALNYRKYFD